MDWRTITINDTNESFRISILNGSNDNFLLNLTDFKELWRENIDWKEALRRAKSENPFMSIEGEECAIERTILSPANQYKCSVNGNVMLLKSKYYIGGVPFHFQWQLPKSSAEVFYEEITRRLLVTLLNVQDQRNELIEIVKGKDLEIAQYKIEGATLARRQIATQPFLDRKFELMSDLTSLVGKDNCNTIKSMCNYNGLINGNSPSKKSKFHKNKEENAMRKFKAKKECKIQYESSCELLPSDEDVQLDTNLKSGTDVQSNATSSIKEQSVEAPKRKLKSKLNL